MRRTDYNHDLLRVAFEGARSLNVSEICRNAKISRQTFYNVVYPDEDLYVTEDKIMAVAKELGFTREQIIKAQQRKDTSKKPKNFAPSVT